MARHIPVRPADGYENHVKNNPSSVSQRGHMANTKSLVAGTKINTASIISYIRYAKVSISLIKMKQASSLATASTRARHSVRLKLRDTASVNEIQSALF